jgi:signal transduction histidine kinase
MNRPLHIWSIFALSVALLLIAVTWVTATALRLEQAQVEVQQQADFEEKVRLALWRMDSLLTPLIVEESARPASHYKSFRSAGPIQTKGGVFMSDEVIPSPLLSQSPPHVRLYFEVDTNGNVSSPEVARGKGGDSLARYMTVHHMVLAADRLAALKKILTEPAALTAKLPEKNAPAFDNSVVLFNAASAPATNVAPVLLTNTWLAQSEEQVPQQFLNARPTELVQQQSRVQASRNSAEYAARANVLQQVAQVGNNGGFGQQPVAPPAVPRSLAVVATSSLVVATSSPAVAKFIADNNNGENPMSPVWLGNALVLARRLSARQGGAVQGVWLNWDELKKTLLANIQDLFPNADLRAMQDTDAAHGGRLLAALPAEFFPNALPRPRSLAWTPLRFTLAIAWAGMLLAVSAVAVLLYGAVSLSERRGAFVSAVTHELRTPLTTFKMYSEMLADGMVQEEAKRGEYLRTLCSEANRLSHLVENVLAYARLERGSARSRVERTSLGELIERSLPRLQERADRAGMKMVVDGTEQALSTMVHVDSAAVEQILFNLVDNACKYAAPTATEKLIHLEALPDGKFAMLRIRDHGAGISAEGAKRLFKPFSKSAQEAAHSAPGIGLGLALCRRLSRSLGGDLRLVAGATHGACFELRLPLSANGEAAALSSI